ncbi:MAG: DUF2325 domain-containing protein [Myxococcales bacterium]
MHIAMIGGLDRNERLFERLAAEHGHTLELHDGKLAGRGGDALRSLVTRAQLVVLTPDVNSHGAVQLGKRVAREYGVPFVVLRTCGTSRFRALLDGLDARKAA